MKTIYSILFLSVTCLIPPVVVHAEGIGATCWARPYSGHRDNPSINMCSVVGETQFPGINAIAGRRRVIIQCQEKNALDYGCAHGQCCYPQCEQVAVCLYATPNQDIVENKDQE